MKIEIYEKHIRELEQHNSELTDTVETLKERIKQTEKDILIKKGELIKRVVLFLNTIYGRMGELQGSILSELNRLNNENLVIADKRMEETIKLITKLIPMDTKPGK